VQGWRRGTEGHLADEQAFMKDSCDVALVGGGLANGLLALRLKQRRPELRVRVIEQADHLGGNHTWSFHSSDLEPDQLAWVRPLIARSWPSHRVFFPGLERRLGGYHSVASSHFHSVLSSELAGMLQLSTPVRTLAPREVALADGSRIAARCVIDGRGFAEDRPLVAGYQKFLGLDLELEQPHGEPDPILMDGRVTQGSQLRFFYTVPWSEHRIQVGEARYSDSPHVDREEFREGIQAYLGARGWKARAIEREEIGVLPAPLEGEWDDVVGRGEVPRSGVRAGLFHATTGYSLPYAVRFADAVCALPQLDSAAVLELMVSTSQREWRRARYFRLLNRMLFRAAVPSERIAMFQQFYRRPEPLIQRFYAGRLEPFDYVRIMTGKPPVSLVRAARVFLGWL
jgi:lycopene beta-cyclase